METDSSNLFVFYADSYCFLLVITKLFFLVKFTLIDPCFGFSTDFRIDFTTFDFSLISVGNESLFLLS